MKNKNNEFYKSLVSGDYKCRNTEEQKKQFRESFGEFVGPSTKIEINPIYGKPKKADEKVIIGHTVEIGDIKNAKSIITAHYDTPLVSYLYHKCKMIRYCGCISYFDLGLCPIAIPIIITYVSLYNNYNLVSAIFLAASLGYLFLHYKCHKPNPTNANDNSSGVCIALHLLDKYPGKVAVILFDCEEEGKKGSKSMKEEFEKNPLYSGKTFINLDTVGCNDAIRIAKDEFEDVDPKMENRKVLLPEDNTFEGKQILFDKSYGDHTDFVNLPKGRRVGIETINGDPDKKCTQNLGPIHSAGDTTVNPEMMECVIHLVEHIMGLNDKQE